MEHHLVNTSQYTADTNTQYNKHACIHITQENLLSGKSQIMDVGCQNNEDHKHNGKHLMSLKGAESLCQLVE